MPWGAIVTTIHPPPEPGEPLKIPPEEDVDVSEYVDQVLDKIVFGKEETATYYLPRTKIVSGVWLPSMEKKKMHVVKSFTSSFIPGYTTVKTNIIEPPIGPPGKGMRGNLTLCGDISGSMGGGIKMESMKTAMIGLIECAKKRNDYVSVYLFGSGGLAITEKTMAYYDTQKRIAGIKQCISGSTRLLEAIERVAIVSRSVEEATTFIITDGAIQDIGESRPYILQCLSYGPVIFIVIEEQYSAKTLKEMFPSAIVEFFPSITSWQDFAQKLVEMFESVDTQRKIRKFG